jgi:hypothetical protein
MPPTNGFSLGIRGRILVLFGLCIGVLLAAAAYGFWQYAASVQLFERDVKASHANAVDVLTIETSFKKQVQEWKDVLLRGKKPEALTSTGMRFSSARATSAVSPSGCRQA